MTTAKSKVGSAKESVAGGEGRTGGLKILRSGRKRWTVKFHLIAERLDKRRFYRYTEQLRAAGLSISNNIAEGSGNTHKQEFIQFLNITRRSLFEDASMLLVFERLGLLEDTEVDELLWDCDEESRKITNFSRTL
jgi:four helix bundle protein